MHTTVFNLMGQITPIMEFKIQIHKKKKNVAKTGFGIPWVKDYAIFFLWK